MHEWKNITNNSWVLKTIQGCEIDFVQIPEQVNVPRQIQFDVDEINLINDEIVELLEKGAIERVSKNNATFLSNIFVVPKKNGKLRPVINLRNLNEYVVYEKFKQESFQTVLHLIQRGDFFCSIDLKDAYFSIPMAKCFQKFLINYESVKVNL